MFHQLAPLTIESAFTKATTAAAEAINERIVDHLKARDAFQKKAAAIAEAPADSIDPDELFDPTVAAERFRLRVAELAIRRDLASVLKLRTADRQAEANRLDDAIAKARETVIGKLRKIGYTGEGLVWDHTAIGSIYPAMVHNHPLVVTAANAAQDAQALADAVYDSQLNGQAIAELEQAIKTARTLAAAA